MNCKDPSIIRITNLITATSYRSACGVNLKYGWTLMSDAPYVLPGNGSTSDLRTYSPSVTLTWEGLALATQWPAVTTYQEFTRDPPHLYIYKSDWLYWIRDNLLVPILMYACQGKVPNPASSPPTILLWATDLLIADTPHLGSFVTGPHSTSGWAKLS